MARVRNILGLIASGIVILSSGIHAILGWKQLSRQLAGIAAPGDLTLALKIAWQFGGVAMLTFGVITAVSFVRRLQGQDVPTLPIALIGIAYVTFGSWALIASSFDPFFAVFIVPGLLLLVSATPHASPILVRQRSADRIGFRASSRLEVGPPSPFESSTTRP
jgi:hypothetical protein